jgi:Protein of unknown function (DUF3592)
MQLMLPHDIARTLDPRTWPWFFDVWVAFAMVFSLKPLWERYQRHRIGMWPATTGQIEQTSVEKIFWSSRRGNQPRYRALLVYSYSWGGTGYSGTSKRPFFSEEEASEFTRDLKGKPVSVHYNPNKPSASGLSDDSIDVLLGTRAPQQPDEAAALDLADSVPAWFRPFIWIFVVLAGIGFAISFWVHVGALFGVQVLPESLFFLMHLGVFLVFLPAVFVARYRIIDANRKNYWKVLLKDSPKWMLYTLYALGAYDFVTFFIFMLTNGTARHTGGLQLSEWRLFSVNWMAFYLAAFAILYSAASSSLYARRCLNGHLMPADANFCTRCGAAVAPTS